MLTKYVSNEGLNERQGSEWKTVNKEAVNCFEKNQVYCLLHWRVSRVSASDLNITDQLPSWGQPRHLGSTVLGLEEARRDFFFVVLVSKADKELHIQEMFGSCPTLMATHSS